MKDSISENEQFFSKVSHDLRGSFTSILGFSDILSDPSEKLNSEEISEFTKRISKQSHDTFELLVNFVNWLKLENYSFGITKEKIELYEVFLDIKNQLQKKLSKKNVTINIDINDSEIALMDYEIFHSIINNIFIFLIKVCNENSKINVNSIRRNSKFSCLEISTSCNNNDSSFLQNIDLRDLKNELSFSIIFAIKFIEQSGGEFDFSVDKENYLNIRLTLPKQ
jgi:two-component system, sensor histidine kinase and response regulator